MKETTDDRFAARYIIDPKTKCWMWIGQLNHEGYARFSWVSTEGKRGNSGHRFSYERFIGLIPVGLQIDHLCHVRACVNPFHLEAVTCRENLLRGDTFQARNAAKIRCDNGHLFDSQNTHIRPDGARSCRACAAGNARRRRVTNGNVFWLAVKSDPIKLEVMRAYKREWAKQKRNRAAK